MLLNNLDWGSNKLVSTNAYWLLVLRRHSRSLCVCFCLIRTNYMHFNEKIICNFVCVLWLKLSFYFFFSSFYHVQRNVHAYMPPSCFHIIFLIESIFVFYVRLRRYKYKNWKAIENENWQSNAARCIFVLYTVYTRTLRGCSEHTTSQYCIVHPISANKQFFTHAHRPQLRERESTRAFHPLNYAKLENE